MRRSVLFLFFITIILSRTAAPFGASPLIKIAVLKDVNAIEITGRFSIHANHYNGTAQWVLKADLAVVQTVPDGFNINDKFIQAPTLIIKGGPFKMGGRTYIGELNIFHLTPSSSVVVNVLPIEDYLVGLVAKEMSTSWPREAIRAQAAAARTYALYMQQERQGDGVDYPYDLEGTVSDQVYEGSDSDVAHVREYIAATKGEVIKFNGKLIKAFYHSTCGGETETPLNVWGESSVLKRVVDPYCALSPYSNWELRLTREELAALFTKAGYPTKTITSIETEKGDNGTRVATVIVNNGSSTFFLNGETFRKIVGYQRLRSCWFDMRVEPNEIVFNGRGYGHGVGMCQWGAKGMAEAGKSYREILAFYYPGTRIIRAY